MPYRVVYAGRHPVPKDLLGRTFSALGSFMRELGVAVDEFGVFMLGSQAAKQQLAPNTAWMPFDASVGVKGAGQKVSIPVDPMRREATGIDIVAPLKSEDTFIAPNATVLGAVTLGQRSSVWYGAVLRGDVNAINVGSNTNIQDNVIVHVARDSFNNVPRPTTIGNNVTVGHGATIHAATIGDGCLVGMGATLLDGVVMEPGSLVAAGAVVAPGTVVKTGQVWAGAPAKLLRTLAKEEVGFVGASAENYARLAEEHRAENCKAFEEVALDKLIADERSWREGTEIDAHSGIHRDPQTQLILSMR